MTHAENGTGDRSEIGGLSSTPKACLGEWERATSIIHAGRRALCFSVIRARRVGSWLRGARQLPDRHDPLEFVAEILKVIRADPHVEHAADTIVLPSGSGLSYRPPGSFLGSRVWSILARAEGDDGPGWGD